MNFYLHELLFLHANATAAFVEAPTTVATAAALVGLLAALCVASACALSRCALGAREYVYESDSEADENEL